MPCQISPQGGEQEGARKLRKILWPWHRARSQFAEYSSRRCSCGGDPTLEQRQTCASDIETGLLLLLSQRG